MSPDNAVGGRDASGLPPKDPIERNRRLITSLNACLDVALPAAGSTEPVRTTTLYVRSASKHALSLFGAGSAHDLLSRPLSDLFAFENAYLVDPLLDAAARGEEVEPVVGLVRSLDGLSIAVRVNATRWTPETLTLMFAAVERSDEVSSRLQIIEQRYGRLFNGVPIALMRVDSRGALGLFEKAREAGYNDLIAYLDDHPDDFEAALDHTRIVDANDHSAKMFGDGTKESVLCPVRVYYRLAPDAFKRNMAAAFGGASHHSAETKICGTAGQERHVLFTIAYPDDAELEGNSFVGMVDIGDRLRAEAELQRTQTEFARAARISLMGELTASIAHEVMQPLSSIGVNSATALKWLAKDPPDIIRASQRLERVAQDAERTAAIVDGMRKMASGGSGERITADLNDIAAEALTFVQDEARSHGVGLHFQRTPRPLRIAADPVQLQQVVVNLVVNAVQAIVHAGTKVKGIEIRTANSPDGSLKLSVRDSGPGIADDHLPHLFDSFFTTKREGIGMGLAICKSIVESHGGTLTIENLRGAGAVASVVLPPVGSEDAR